MASNSPMERMVKRFEMVKSELSCNELICIEFLCYDRVMATLYSYQSYGSVSARSFSITRDQTLKKVRKTRQEEYSCSKKYKQPMTCYRDTTMMSGRRQ